MAVEINPSDFYDFLFAEIGKPYHYGDEGPNSFDCSGLVQYVYGHFGVHTPRTAHEQQSWTTSTGTPQFGDLVFWGHPAYHVGIVVQTKDVLGTTIPMMIDAAGDGMPVAQHAIAGQAGFGRVPGVKWLGGVSSGTGKANDIPFGKVTDAAKAVVGWGEAITNLVGALLDPHTWLRIGEVTLGLILIAVGTAKLTNAFPSATKIAKAVR